MSDLISRQAIMERIENEYRQWGEEYDVQQVLGDIEDMPSVTPCKDAISRTKAIEEIRIYRMKDSNDPDIKAFNDGIDTAISVIGHNIPPVTPQRPKGHWIDDTDKRAWKCSECGWWYRDWRKHNFCPNCGCRMVGDDNENGD